MKARKKPVEIDYFPIEYTEKCTQELIDWIASFGDKFRDHFTLEGEDGDLHVKTLEGTSYAVSDKDVIIRGVAGEYYPCKKNIFNDTYDVLPVWVNGKEPYTTNEG